jgi:hypothetical protein
MAYRRTIKEQAARSRATSSVSHSMRWNVGISTTSCAPSPPRPPRALGDGHPPASPGSHEDFKATRKWTFLDDPEKRKAYGYRKISAWCGYSFARFSCCLSIEKAVFRCLFLSKISSVMGFLSQDVYKRKGYCWSFYSHSTPLLSLCWILHAHGPATTAYAKHHVRHFGVDQQYRKVL